MLNVLALLIFLPSLSHSDQTLSLELKSPISYDGQEVFKWVEVADDNRMIITNRIRTSLEAV